MVFKDLLNLEGQVINYYIVKGNNVSAKRAKVHMSNYYGGNELQLQLVDRLGRCQQYCYHSIDLRGNHFNKDPKNSSSYRIGYNNSYLFLDKKEAYNHVINNLRKQRQEINRKMLKAQMELYDKKMEVENDEG